MKLLVMAQGFFEATNHVRWVVPLKILSKTYMKNDYIAIEKDPRKVHSHEWNSDALILIRWFHPNFIQILKQIKKQNPKLKIIYDTDDLLTELPKYNYAKGLIHKTDVKYFLEEVDGYIFSTEPLAKQTRKILSVESMKKPYVIIENRLDKSLWGEPIFNSRIANEKLRVGFEGTGNRFKTTGYNGIDDFDHLIDVYKQTKHKYRWVFFGGIPQSVIDPKEIEYVEWQDRYPEFVKSMLRTEFHVGLSPLDNNVFNKCKSDIKRLDYFASGCPGLYSHCVPYLNTNLPESVVLKNFPNAWVNALEDMEKEEYRKFLWDEDNKYYKDHPEEIWIQENIQTRYSKLKEIVDAVNK